MDRNISFPWAFTLAAKDTAALAVLRLASDVEVGTMGDLLWVRGPASDAACVAMLSTIPVVNRYEWMEGNQLRPYGSRLVTASFPSINWHRLSKWMEVHLPTPRIAAPRTQASLKLLPSSQSRPSSAVLTSIDLFAEWSTSAPAVRLNPLRFAASAEGQVLVLGSPPPSIPGQPMVEVAGIVIPAGYCWSPAVSEVVVRSVLGAGPATVILWDLDGYQLLHDELFVAASRSSVRASHANRLKEKSP